MPADVWLLWTQELPATNKRGAKMLAFGGKFGSFKVMDEADHIELTEPALASGAFPRHRKAAVNWRDKHLPGADIKGGLEKWPFRRRRWSLIVKGNRDANKK